jgi:type III restriction enzyme
MTEQGTQKEIVYQLFIEPKGEPYLLLDKWKEDFLEDIETEQRVELFQTKEYKLIGMPFYNKTLKEVEFDSKLKNI